jgi:hypothetical protein
MVVESLKNFSLRKSFEFPRLDAKGMNVSDNRLELIIGQSEKK